MPFDLFNQPSNYDLPTSGVAYEKVKRGSGAEKLKRMAEKVKELGRPTNAIELGRMLGIPHHIVCARMNDKPNPLYYTGYTTFEGSRVKIIELKTENANV